MVFILECAWSGIAGRISLYAGIDDLRLRFTEYRQKEQTREDVNADVSVTVLGHGCLQWNTTHYSTQDVTVDLELCK